VSAYEFLRSSIALVVSSYPSVDIKRDRPQHPCCRGAFVSDGAELCPAAPKSLDDPPGGATPRLSGGGSAMFSHTLWRPLSMSLPHPSSKLTRAAFTSPTRLSSVLCAPRIECALRLRFPTGRWQFAPLARRFGNWRDDQKEITKCC